MVEVKESEVPSIMMVQILTFDAWTTFLIVSLFFLVGNISKAYYSWQCSLLNKTISNDSDKTTTMIHVHAPLH